MSFFFWCAERKKIVSCELTFAFLACPDGKTPRTPEMAGTLWHSLAINRSPEARGDQCKKQYYKYPILSLLSLSFSISCGPKSHKKRSHPPPPQLSIVTLVSNYIHTWDKYWRWRPGFYIFICKFYPRNLGSPASLNYSKSRGALWEGKISQNKLSHCKRLKLLLSCDL